MLDNILTKEKNIGNINLILQEHSDNSIEVIRTQQRNLNENGHIKDSYKHQ